MGTLGDTVKAKAHCSLIDSGPEDITKMMTDDTLCAVKGVLRDIFKGTISRPKKVLQLCEISHRK